jgi:hypothetical protein
MLPKASVLKMKVSMGQPVPMCGEAVADFETVQENQISFLTGDVSVH